MQVFTTFFTTVNRGESRGTKPFARDPPYAKWGKQAEAKAVLAKCSALSAERYVPPYYIALIYNGLDERDETLAWLERGFQERDVRLVFLKVEPMWNNLRFGRR